MRDLRAGTARGTRSLREKRNQRGSNHGDTKERL